MVFGFGGLTEDERRSAAMSGASPSKVKRQTKMSTFGSPAGSFIDFTNPNVRQTRPDSQEFEEGMVRGQNAEQNILGRVRRAAKTPMRKALVRGQMQKDLADAQAGMDAERIAAREVQKAKIKAALGSAKTKFISGKDLVQQEMGRAHGIATHHQQVSFSREQEMLGQMFGQGEKIWGTNNQPVVIHNDLNSSRSDPFDETAGMFGFGDHGERSGLF